ncbi:hypothetical protein HHK36_008637 [Tetracentron sinense]|uniref:Uncharacterized protein n=1 Tax=Tetracentron sinense TaxID=13715 RepID=A0A835DNI8_TETSI|nr:hypothetical protein HHK36_008637 [Tetracentron sinense]
MAQAVVSFAIKRLGEFLIQEAVFLYGVRDEVEQLKIELKRMQCFLKDADAFAYRGDERVRNWVAEIKDAAYDSEDVLDTFIYKVASRKRGGFHGVLKRYTYILTEWIDVHQVGEKIKAIGKKIDSISTRMQTSGIRNIIGEGEGMTLSNERQRLLRRSYAHFEEEDVVALEKDIKVLMAQLKKEERRLRRGCFTGISTANEEEKNKIEKMKVEELVEKIHEVLQEKRYVVVLDDIWSNEVWDSLKPAFPNGKMGSKIMLITRNREVALHADPWSDPHEHRSLTNEESYELLWRKSFPIEIDHVVVSGGFEELGREMVKRCWGLPLAVVVLGGILATKKSLKEWEMVRKNVNLYFRRGQQQGGVVMGILDLSYQDLPYNLKPCFLYLGIFPEDSQISAKKLIRLWVAEGFVQEPEEEGTLTMEDIAEQYLTELVNRRMIYVDKINSMGKIKTYRLHDLIRDLCISKAKDENFMLVLDSSSADHVPNERAGKLRRLVIHPRHVTGRYVAISPQTPHLRSLLFFPPTRNVTMYKEFKLLRVLSLERVNFEGSLPREVGSLIYLRYLGLRGSNLRGIPPSLGNLQRLQTLDLRRVGEIFKMPNVIWKMEQLRHLYLSGTIGSKDLRLDTLRNLLTLSEINGGNWIEKDLKVMTNLRKLGLNYIERPEHVEGVLRSPIFRSDQLYSLYMHFSTFSWPIDKESSNLEPLSHCQRLSKLRLDGTIEKLVQEDFQFPPNITKLTFSYSYFKHDPMAMLHNLPSLRVVRLYRDPYIGKEMICSAQGFPKLEFLELWDLPELEEWRVEEGSMPSLRQLKIMDCKKLRMLPQGLRFVTTLKELQISSMPEEFCDRLRAIDGLGRQGEDFYKVQHIPNILIHRSRSTM